MTDEGTVGQTHSCSHCEVGRGSQLYYTHQQLMARYILNRRSMGMVPIMDVDFTRTHTPFKSHLTCLNGVDICGRDYEYNMMLDKEKLVKNVFTMEKRLLSAIDKGQVLTTQSTYLPLYDKKGLDMLGSLIEGTGRSINLRFKNLLTYLFNILRLMFENFLLGTNVEFIKFFFKRYYGSLLGAARQLLGGAPIAKHFWEPNPSTLEISHTMTRDPIFYKLWKRIIGYFYRWQDSLPSYKQQDLIFPGVEIESVKFDNLITYCEDFLVDINSATSVPVGDEVRKDLKIKTVVERLNHKPYTYKVVVVSERPVKNAVVRTYLGPKYDYDDELVNVRKNRNEFVEIDQFICDREYQNDKSIKFTYNLLSVVKNRHSYHLIHFLKRFLNSVLQSRKVRMS